MARTLFTLVACAAVYGSTLGAAHSLTFALRNTIKFPLLILVTGLVCSLAYYGLARLVTSRLSFRAIQSLVWATYRDIAVLLVALSPVTLFLALVLDQATSKSDLGHYPLFLGINVIFIAIAGMLTLGKQALALVREHGLPRTQGAIVLFLWLAVSLPVGGQWSWYLRPFFGVRALGGTENFCLGTIPDFRGATSFFEAVYNLVDPPQL
jgi:hypothetical protein